MSELLLPSDSNTPKPHIASLSMQPNFPREDLNEDNASILSFTLQKEEGLSAYAERLQYYQGYVHLIADRALKSLDIKTRYAEEELLSFSRGFAAFETISDLVHPPRVYNIALAKVAIEKIFIDTRDFFEIQLEEFHASVAENRAALPVTRDRPAPELDLANRYTSLADTLPNTYGVLIDIGTTQNENMAQLQTRTMGATLAHSLQVADLD